MSGVYKRPSDRARGKAGKWTCWYKDAEGRRKTCVGFTSRSESLALVNHLDTQAKKAKEGLTDAGDEATRKAAFAPIQEHLDAYHKHLKSKGGVLRGYRDRVSMTRRLLGIANVSRVDQITAEKIQLAIGELRKDLAARTTNHALKYLKEFVRWLDDTGRIARVPRGLLAINGYNVSSDRRWVRRSASRDEVERLLGATEVRPPVVVRRKGRGGPPLVWMSGPQRAALYRLALATGFRVGELKSLTPECFHLRSEEPYIELSAVASKNRKGARQPITKEFAVWFLRFMSDREPGKPIFILPKKTADMLRKDLEAAGIPYKDQRGRVLDFHALRKTYISLLVASGVSPKITQTLARHSTITMTMDVYAEIDDKDVRTALEDQEKPK